MTSRHVGALSGGKDSRAYRTLGEAPMTDEEWQRRHDAIVTTFPDGLTREQFETLTLGSADETGRVEPPSVGDWFAGVSALMGMMARGLLTRRDGHRGGPWMLTDAGRQEATKSRVKELERQLAERTL